MKLLRALTIAAISCSPPALAEADSWYAYWGVGLAHSDHPAAVEAAFRRADAVPGAERLAVSAEMFGFYWPLRGTGTLVGVVLDYSDDQTIVWHGDTEGPTLVQVRQRLYALSAMHFWGDEPGRGFFVRGDLGPASLDYAELDAPPVSGSGFGMLLGAGYGFPMFAGGDAWFVLNVTHSSKLLEGETYSTSAVNLAVLW